MASYGLEERFKVQRDCFRLTDPGAYDYSAIKSIKPNKYGFLSNTPRVTLPCGPLYTQNIYNVDIERHLPNVTVFKSKTPRFTFKPFDEEELDAILCTCDTDKTCECPLGEERECHANVHKRLYKGPPPHSAIGTGLSIPTKRDRGFEICNDGTTRRLLDVVKEECPPFYDARVSHSPEFYRGCKWSQWKTPRTGKSLEVRPGPADYCIEKVKTLSEVCLERVQSQRRKESKFLRYVEEVQERNLREGRPGPSHYHPQLPKGTQLQFLGPKAPRFHCIYDQHPSPADYSVKRDFDLPKPPLYPCIAKLPPPAGFGVKAKRFRQRAVEGPGPGAYDAGVKLCKVVNCSKAPFGCSASRFKEEKLDFDVMHDDDELCIEEEEETKICPPITWQFRSRTKRFKPNTKAYDPVLSYKMEAKVERSVRLQEIAPFHSSEGRFQPWFDWLPLSSGVETPGPGYYNLWKPRCLPAVNGPLYRDRRFKENRNLTPAPNEYKRGGIETVLRTFNKKLKENVKKKGDSFKWLLPEEPIDLSPTQREVLILDRAIKQLEVDESSPIDPDKTSAELSADKTTDNGKGDTDSKDNKVVEEKSDETEPPKKKLLRTFLYKHKMQHYF